MTTHYIDFKRNKDKTHLEDIERFIEECNLWYIGTGQKAYFRSLGVGDVFGIKITKSALKDEIKRIFKNIKGAYDDLETTIHEKGRAKHGVIFDFDGPNEMLNLFDYKEWTRNWTIPHKLPRSKPHQFFNILMKAISGGDENFQHHLERCLLRKRFCPFDYEIPCIVWNEPGGIGKQLFVENLLATIFDGQIYRADGKHVFGTHTNKGVMGMTVVYADEINFSADAQLFRDAKRAIWNEYPKVRALYGDLQTVRNTAWYILSGNDAGTIVPLTGGGADRRFSEKKIGFEGLKKKDLEYYVEQAGAHKEFGSARDYVSHSVDVLKDEGEVAVWLGSLVMQHGLPYEKEKLTHYTEGGYRDTVFDSQDELKKTLDLVIMSGVFTSFKTSDLLEFHNETLQARYKINNEISLGKSIRTYMSPLGRNISHLWDSTGKADGGERCYKLIGAVDNRRFHPSDITEDSYDIMYEQLMTKFQEAMPPSKREYERGLWTYADVITDIESYGCENTIAAYREMDCDNDQQQGGDIAAIAENFGKEGWFDALDDRIKEKAIESYFAKVIEMRTKKRPMNLIKRATIRIVVDDGDGDANPSWDDKVWYCEYGTEPDEE